MSGIEKLKSAAVKNAKPALNKKTGKPRETLIADGGGLYLVVSASGSKSWALVWSDSGRRRLSNVSAYGTDLGLG